MAYTHAVKADSKVPRAESIAIRSSFIQTAAYDGASQTLTVEFKTGEPLVYHEVDKQTWEQFRETPSKGSFYARMIKGKFSSVNIKRGLKVSDFEKAVEKTRRQVRPARQGRRG